MSLRQKRRQIFFKNIGVSTVDRADNRHLYRPGVRLVQSFDIQRSEFYRAGRDNYQGTYSGYTSGGFYREGNLKVASKIASWSSEAIASPWNDSFKNGSLDVVEWSDYSTGSGTLSFGSSGMTMDASNGEPLDYAAIFSLVRWKEDIDWTVSFKLNTALSQGHTLVIEPWDNSNVYHFSVGWEQSGPTERFFIRFYTLAVLTREILINASIPTEGKLRVTRTKGTWTASWFDGQDWNEIGRLYNDPDWDIRCQIRCAANNGTNPIQLVLSNFIDVNKNRSADKSFPVEGFIVIDGRDIIILDKTEQVWMRFVGGIQRGWPYQDEDYEPTFAYVENGKLFIGFGAKVTVPGKFTRGGIIWFDFGQDEMYLWGWLPDLFGIVSARWSYELLAPPIPSSPHAPISYRHGYGVCDWMDVSVPPPGGLGPQPFDGNLSMNFRDFSVVKGEVGEKSIRLFITFQDLILNIQDTENIVHVNQTSSFLYTKCKGAAKNFYVLYTDTSRFGIQFFRDASELEPRDFPLFSVVQDDIGRQYMKDVGWKQAIDEYDLIKPQNWNSLAITLATSPAAQDTIFIGADNAMYVLYATAEFETDGAFKANMGLEIFSSRNRKGINAVLHGRIGRVVEMMPDSTAGREFGQLVYLITSEAPL